MWVNQQCRPTQKIKKANNNLHITIKFKLISWMSLQCGPTENNNKNHFHLKIKVKIKIIDELRMPSNSK